MKGKKISALQRTRFGKDLISKMSAYLVMRLSLLLALTILTAHREAVAQSSLDCGTPVGVAPGTPTG